MICKQIEGGTCCQGVPRQGIMPAFTSSKNQDWNFPEAHFLPFNPQSRNTVAKSVSEGQMLVVGQGAETSRRVSRPCLPLCPKAPLLTQKEYEPSSVVFSPSLRKGFRLKRAAFNPSSTTLSPGDICTGHLTSLNLHSLSVKPMQ